MPAAPGPPCGCRVPTVDCDEFCSQLSGYSDMILNTATQQHPSVLLFTLDISQLSRLGLAPVEKVFGRSSLEQLKIAWTPVNPSLSDSIARVLGSVRSTLKSLVFSGSHIDAWIRLWLGAQSAFQGHLETFILIILSRQIRQYGYHFPTIHSSSIPTRLHFSATREKWRPNANEVFRHVVCIKKMVDDIPQPKRPKVKQ